MSDYSVNFLKQQRKKVGVQQKRDRLFFTIAGGVCGIAIVLALVSMGIRLFLTFDVNRLQSRQEFLTAEIQSREEAERSYVIFVAKLKQLAELFAARTDKQEAIQYFLGIAGPEVMVSDISYEAGTAELSFGLDASSIFSLEELIDTLNSQEVKDRFSAVRLNELRRTNTGMYNMSVTVAITELVRPGRQGSGAN